MCYWSTEKYKKIFEKKENSQKKQRLEKKSKKIGKKRKTVAHNQEHQ